MAIAHWRKADDGSVILSLPEDTLSELSFAQDAAVDVTVRNGELIIRNEISLLDRALAEYHLMPRDLEEDRAWVNAPAVGRELI
jgi:antitoxin component of MazEF toxin-antitoxin module